MRGTMQEKKTKKDQGATTARSIHIDAIVKEENTTSVNIKTNNIIIERERISERERESISVRERALVRGVTVDASTTTKCTQTNTTAANRPTPQQNQTLKQPDN
jgi:hypothetical protein